MQITVPDPTYSNTMTHFNGIDNFFLRREMSVEKEYLYFIDVNNIVYININRSYRETDMVYINGGFYKKVK